MDHMVHADYRHTDPKTSDSDRPHDSFQQHSGHAYVNLGYKTWTYARLCSLFTPARIRTSRLSKHEFHAIQTMLGRDFTIDTAADDLGVTKQTQVFYSPARPFTRLHALGTSETLWVNTPYRDLSRWIRHYRTLKHSNPTLSACFVVPNRPLTMQDTDVQSLMQSAQILKTIDTDTPAFQRYDGTYFSAPWPVHVVYDPPSPAVPILRSYQSDDNARTLTFPAMLAGTPVSSLLDTGATHNFIDERLRRRLRLHLRATPFPTVSFANQSGAPLMGECRFKLCIGAYTATVTALVLDLATHLGGHDVILGKPFLAQNGAVIDVAAHAVTFRAHTDKAVVVERHTLVGRNQTTDLDIDMQDPDLEFDERCFTEAHLQLLTAKETLTLLRSGVHFVAANIKVRPDAETKIKAEMPECYAYAHGEVKPGPVPQDELTKTLADYAPVFEPIPAHQLVDRPVHHLIPLKEKDTRPFIRPIYKLTPKEQEEAEKQIKDLLAKGWIRPSQSPWAAPILFAPKPDGTLRMCIDYRGLNRLTVQNAYPMPRIDMLLDRLKDSKVFSSIDLQAGYHQIKIAEEDIPKTAFRSTIGHFEYTVMPFGLTNAPATFQELMNRLFEPLITKGYVTVYLDDILIHSKDAKDHLKHIKEVLQILKDNKLYAKESKCEWNRTEVTFLGHLVGSDGIRMDPKKIDVVQNWPTPKTQTELRSFLGLANYFRKFVLGYANIAAVLNDLLKKQVPQQFDEKPDLWTAAHQDAFEKLKTMISKDIVLQYPDMNKPFEVITDASLYGTGAVLLQDGRPVAFTSKKFIPAEKNYTTGEQELLGVVNALKEWRCYLEGPVVTLVTDHHPLIYLQTQANLSRRQTRWLEFLQRFHLQWEYRPGRTNVADPLSRNPRLRYMHAQALLNAVTRAKADNPLRDRILAAQRTDPYFSDTQNVTTDNLKQTIDQFWVKTVNSPITQRPVDVIVVPHDDELRKDIMHMHHGAPAAGHQGMVRTYDLVRRLYWWPSMRADIETFVASCDTCQRNKAASGKTAGELAPLPIPDRPWLSVGMDFVTGLPQTKNGYNAMFVMVDRFSKMVHVRPTTNKFTAAETADMFLDAVFRAHGVPSDTVSDRGTNFTSAFWKAFSERLGFKVKLSSSYHPQTDGQTERTNRVVTDTLRHYTMDCQNNWDKHLPIVEFAINNAVNAATGMSPFYVLYGHHPLLPSNLFQKSENPAGLTAAEHVKARYERAKRCLQAAQDRMRHQFDKDHRPQTFEPNSDQVLLSTKNFRTKAPTKILPRYMGPFKVLEKIGDQAYRLELPKRLKIHDVFHTSLLKLYTASSVYKPPPIGWAPDGEALWEVEKILKHSEIVHPDSEKNPKKRSKPPKHRYLIRWAGYSAEHDTWEPEEQILDKKLLEDYWKKTTKTPED